MNLHIVHFEKYCSNCKYSEFSESENPCWNCLNQSVNEDTDMPAYYVDAKK